MAHITSIRSRGLPTREICHLAPRLARVPTVVNRISVRPPFPCHGCQRSFCDLFSNFERAVRVNGGGSCDIVPPKSLRIYRSTAVLGLDSWGWDLNKEILPGSRRSRLDRRPKFPPLSYYIVVWGGVGGRGEGWGRLSNMAEWATIARPTRDNTNLGLNKP